MNPAHSLPSASFDAGQAEQFLKLLGKDPAQTWFRTFYGKRGTRRRHPRGGRDLHGFNAATLAAENAMGLAVYAVIGHAEQATGTNSKGEPTGAVCDRDVVWCPALFNEHDNRPREWQLTAWQEFGLPEPSLQVDTGGKSIHSYWLLDSPITGEQFRDLQLRLIELTGSDKQVQNPSRVMRLPGFRHVNKTTGELGEMVQLVNSPGHRYSLAHLESCLPEPEPEPEPEPAAPLPDRLPGSGDLPPRPIEALYDALQRVPEFHHGEGRREELLKLCLRLWVELGRDEALALMRRHSPHLKDLDGYFNTEPREISPGSLWPFLRDQYGIDIRRHDLTGQQANNVIPFPLAPITGEELAAAAPGPSREPQHRPASSASRAGLQKLIRDTYTVRWNDLKKEVEIDGHQMLSIDLADQFLADRHGVEAPRDRVRGAFQYVARSNPYNPITEYFDGITARTDLAPLTPGEVAWRFGIAAGDLLSQELLARHLVGAYRRGITPGHKHDQVLILQGQQGRLKGMAIKALAPPGLFTSRTDVKALEDREFLATVNSVWLLEIDEIDRVLMSRSASEFKGFVTREADTYVEKWETQAIEHPRRSVLFGSTNEAEILHDHTGNRRAWLVPVAHTTDPAWITANRERIWRSVTLWAAAGLKNWVPESHPTAIKAAERAAGALLSDPWEASIRNVLEQVPDPEINGISQTALIRQALEDLEIARITRDVQMRITRIVTGSTFTTHGGRWRWVQQKRRYRNPAGVGGAAASGYMPARSDLAPAVPTCSNQNGGGLERGTHDGHCDLLTLFQPFQPSTEGEEIKRTDGTAPALVPPMHAATAPPGTVGTVGTPSQTRSGAVDPTCQHPPKGWNEVGTVPPRLEHPPTGSGADAFDDDDDPAWGPRQEVQP